MSRNEVDEDGFGRAVSIHTAANEQKCGMRMVRIIHLACTWFIATRLGIGLMGTKYNAVHSKGYISGPSAYLTSS
jgi:hypothetical protein